MPVSESVPRNESLQRTLCDLVRQNDELKLANRRLTETYSVSEVAEMLWARGFQPEGLNVRDVVFDFAWNHPDWFRSGCLTVVGGECVRLSEGGLVFTWHGVGLVLDQFVGVKP